MVQLGPDGGPSRPSTQPSTRPAGNGGSSGGNGSSGVVFQSEFDKRNLPRAYDHTQIRRGQMWLDSTHLTDKSTLRAIGGKTTLKLNEVASTTRLASVQFGFQFLYNPSTLSLGFQQDQSLYPPGTDPGGGNGTDTSANDSITILGPGSSTLAFDLILDRTYECWDQGPPTDATSQPRFGGVLDVDPRRGIMVDFEHWNAMMGYTEDAPFVISQPMFLSFGNTRGNFYYGYVTSYTFGISNWTQNMIPNRGGISGIQFSILPLPRALRLTQGTAAPGFRLGSNAVGVTTNNLPDEIGIGISQIPDSVTPANPGATPPPPSTAPVPTPTPSPMLPPIP